MLFCQANSPLFGYNDYQDLAIYQVVSKAIRNGQVLYAETFDHKGPMLFLIGTLIYYSKFTVWILDIATYQVQAIFLYKQFRLFKDSGQSLAAQIFVMGCEIQFMWDAGSPEQIYMAFVYIQMYLILRAKNDWKDWVAYSLMVQFVFYSKINVLFYWIPMFIYLVYKQIKDRKLTKNLIAGQIPFLSMQAIVFGYFIYNNKLQDFIDGYFIKNMGYQERVSRVFQNYVQASLIGAVLLIYLIIIRKQRNANLNILTCQIIQLIIGEIALSGHVYPYYIILIIPFIQLIFMKKVNWQKLLAQAVQILSLQLYAIQCVNFVQIHPNQFLKPIENDIRYQFYKDIQDDLEASGKTWEDFKGVQTQYMIQPNLAYYLPVNPVKHQTYCNMTYETNPEMFDSGIEALKNKELDYVCLTIDADGNIMCNSKQINTERSYTSESIKYIKQNYEEYKRYSINDDFIAVVYKVKA